MADETSQGTAGSGEGQPAAATSAPDTSASAPAQGTQTTQAGQPDGGSAATTSTTGTQEADHVFDPVTFKEKLGKLPEDVRQDVEAFYKSLQGNYTKKTQAIAEHRRKIEAYDAMSKNPQQAAELFARQLGMKLTPAQAEAAAKSAAGQGWSPEKGDPQNWNEVVGYLTNQIRTEFGSKLQPVFQEFQNIKRQSIEQQLSEIDPAWQTHEEVMMENLKAHPTLATNPAALYRLSVPPEILESRATQRALQKMEAKTKSSQVGGASTTNKKSDGFKLPDKAVSFQDAVKAAREKLAADGIRPGT